MRKIGELKGKPIIEGNPNEIKNNQIHYKESEGNINLSERKNGNLETISGGNESSASKLKSRKVCWVVDNEKLTDETFATLKSLLLEILALYPLYSSIYEEFDSSVSNNYKYYGPFVNLPLCNLLVADNANWKTWYFEEAEDIENYYDGFIGVIKELDPSFTEEMVYELTCLKRIPYEEYMALRIEQEKGKDYIY